VFLLLSELRRFRGQSLKAHTLRLDRDQMQFPTLIQPTTLETPA